MSARPPATREGFEFRAAVLFFWAPRMQFGWIAPPGRERRQRQTRRKPGTQSPEATARDAACHASRAAEPHSRREGFMRCTTSWVWSALVGGALLAACEQPPSALDPDFGVTSVGVTPQTYVLQVGDSVQLTATVVTSNGRPPHAVSWTSSASAIASVSATGMVRGRAAGSARVYAASGSKKDSAAVAVTSTTPPPPVPVELVAITPASASVPVGATVQLTATPKDSTGNVLTGRAISWTSSNTAVSSVSAGGLVTGVAAGAAT